MILSPLGLWLEAHSDAVTAVATWMALAPLAWLAVGKAWGQSRDAAWWWLAGAFAISFVADVQTSFTGRDWSAVTAYPVAQSALVGAVFLSRRRALAFLVALSVAAVAVIVLRGAGPDPWVPVIGWGTVTVLALKRASLPARLRLALLVYFGAGLVTWLIRLTWFNPTWFGVRHAAWYPYQLARLAGLMLFCWATLKPGPSLRLVETR